MVYDPATKATHCLADALHFPNGQPKRSACCMPMHRCYWLLLLLPSPFPLCRTGRQLSTCARRAAAPPPAAGLAASEDESFLLVAETDRMALLKLWLEGPKVRAAAACCRGADS
jgi:hypothetical protein